MTPPTALTSRQQTPSDAVFVMPYYGEGPHSRAYLDRALAGLRRQSDPHWRLVVVDDASPAADEADFLHGLAAADPRIHVLVQPANTGAGECRNTGVRWAAEHGASIVLFHDADDIAHERRLELTRQILDRRPDVDFVYSTFLVIDEDDRLVPVDTLTPSIREILDVHADAPVHGPDAWQRIATETGYASQTSTVGVRIELALDQPFPAIRGSEDSHTWLRMSAAGRGVAYAPGIATLYRVPQSTGSSSDRARVGLDEYYRVLVTMNEDGFAKAVDLALERGRLDPAAVPGLWARFLRRLAVTVRREQQHGLADAVLDAASRWDARATEVVGGVRAVEQGSAA